MKGNNLKTEIELFVIDKVKEMRLKANISQAQLAIKIDVSVGFIGHVESPNKRAKYNLNHLNKLVLILDCKFQDFFPDEALDA